MKAKKSLGQNFLKDKGILKKITDFAQIEKTDTVVEVGPGEGSLTEVLLERAGKVMAIEKDERLVDSLREKFQEQILNNRLEIINADILNYELRIKNYVLMGNIPYYITGALFKKFLSTQGGEFNQPKSITFVVQKEVADRIIAKNGKESILSISIKAYGEPQYGGIIKAGSFNPKPKVNSAIIAIRNINKERFKNISENKFFEILKKGFAHKRKLLINNLEIKKEVFDICEISKKVRAENLSVDNWICLTKNLL
jgi:16S rRNA (adenine1518-N6/adenine1519-N6)-dimethyltransferase